MAGERTLPGLGLTAFWTLGDDTWKPGMDANIQKLSALAQPVVLSALAAAPGTPTDGDVHIASAAWAGIAAAQSIVIRDNAAWVEIVPSQGWSAYNVALAGLYRFNGSAWILATTGTVYQTKTAAFTLTDAELSGRHFITMNVAAAHNFTVPPDLTGTGALTVAAKGAGQTTFVAGVGVTIRSKGSNKKISATGVGVSLVPIATNEYFLFGDLAA